MLWLRWETLNGELVLTGQEEAEQRAARLAKKLQALGVDLNDIEWRPIIAFLNPRDINPPSA